MQLFSALAQHVYADLIHQLCSIKHNESCYHPAQALHFTTPQHLNTKNIQYPQNNTIQHQSWNPHLFQAIEHFDNLSPEEMDEIRQRRKQEMIELAKQRKVCSQKNNNNSLYHNHFYLLLRPNHSVQRDHQTCIVSISINPSHDTNQTS